MAGAHARKGAEEVTPKGLYRRQGRIDERSEIYPVLMNPTRNPTPLGVVLFKIPAPFPHHPHFCDRVNHYNAMPAQWDCPTNIKGTRAERHGRGYPEGVILSRGQG